MALRSVRIRWSTRGTETTAPDGTPGGFGSQHPVAPRMTSWSTAQMRRGDSGNDVVLVSRGWREAIRVVLWPGHLKRTAATALLVGAILFAINQLNVVIRALAEDQGWRPPGVTEAAAGRAALVRVQPDRSALARGRAALLDRRA